MGSWTDRDEWRWAGEETWRDNEPRHWRSTNERGIGERMREGLHEMGERVKDTFDPDRDGRLGRSEPRNDRESRQYGSEPRYGSDPRYYGGESRQYGSEPRYYGSEQRQYGGEQRGVGERMRENQSDWSPREHDSSRHGSQRFEYQGQQRWPEHERGSRMGHGAEFQYPIARDPAFEWGREDYGRGRDLRTPQSGSMLGQTFGTQNDERWPSGILDDDRSRYRASQGIQQLGTRREPTRPRTPKGYRRPDTTLLDEVCLVLGHDVDVDASEIEVEVLNGEVTLKGSVETRDQKRWAESLAEGVRGVVDVHNQLRVRSSMLDRAVEKVKDALGVDRTPDRRTT